MRILLTLILTILIPSFVFADSDFPSFDCSNAKIETEHAICENMNLAVLDVDIANEYRSARVSVADTKLEEDLMKEQVAFVYERNKCGDDVECLNSIMKSRLAELGGFDIKVSGYATTTYQEGDSPDCASNQKSVSGKTICENYENVEHYVNIIFADPQAALNGLQKIDTPASKLFQAYLYRFDHINIEDRLGLADQLMNEAIALASNKINQLPYPDIDTSKAYKYDDETLFFSHMREIVEVDPTDIPNDIFKLHGRVAIDVFSEKYGSQLDNLAPMVDISKELKALKNISAFKQKLFGAAPCRQGTSKYGRYREMETAFIDMLYEIKLDPEIEDCDSNLECNEEDQLDRYLKYWSGWGQWNYNYYNELKALEGNALEELQDYYKTTFGLKEPEKRAKNAIKNVKEVYLSHYSRSVFDNKLEHNIIGKINNGTFEAKDLNSFIEELASRSAEDIDSTKDMWSVDHSDYPADERFQGNVILNALILNGADIETIVSLVTKIDLASGSRNYDPSLLVAVSRPNVLESMLSIGVPVNIANGFGKTALHAAIQQSQQKSIEILLKNGADINTPTYDEEKMNPWDCDGYSGLKAYERTPLMYAAWQSKLPIIQQLVESGADISLRDSNGAAAIDYLSLNELLSPEDSKNASVLLSPPAEYAQ